METPKVKCDYEFCRGITSGCRFSLVNEPSLVDGVKQAVENSVPAKPPQGLNSLKPVEHQRLRFAMAACPNACTMPQIKDIGIIANVTPAAIGPDCNGCGKCESICRERAIIVSNGKAQLVPENCVGCGLCISICPNKAIQSDGLKFRILAGGKMGRHPRWAKQLCVADGSSLTAELERLFGPKAKEPEQTPGNIKT
jgi:anaerobic sulfite reductase subunit C